MDTNMDTLTPTMAREIAEAANAFQQQQTGHTPRSITVALSQDTLVITLHGALSPAEQALARSSAGAAQLQEYHRQLFATSSATLRQEIKRITGIEVQEAAAEVEPATGTVVHAFTTGTMVQVFHLVPSPPEHSPGATPPAPPVHSEAGNSAGPQPYRAF